MKLRSSRKKRSNTDSSVAAKGPLKTRIKLTVKSLEDISATVILAISSSPRNSSQKSVRKPVKKSVKPAPLLQVKQSIKQPVKPVKKPVKKSVKKSVRKAFTPSSNVNYFVFLKISNDDEIDDDLLTDDEAKKSAE
jgi:hypothetical protein